MMHSGFETTLTKYCTSCHATEKNRLFITINDAWLHGNTGGKYTAGIFKSDANGGGLPIKCDFCGSYHTLLIDEKIGEVIAVLNQKGYETAFSCDGDKDGTTPYISFNYNTTPLDIFNTLPDGWDVSLNADLNMDVDNEKSTRYTSIYYNCMDANWDKDAMIQWASILPYNDRGQCISALAKSPGQRYALEDIKTAFEYKGYAVSSIKAFQLNGKWVCIIKFDESVSLPYALFCDDATMVSNCEIAIMLDSISTDCIHSIVDKILALYGRI